MAEAKVMAGGLIISAALAAAGFVAGMGELSPFLRGGSSAATEPLHSGLSPSSQRLVLTDCMDALVSLSSQPDRADDFGMTNDTCAAAARGIVDQAPTFSLGWYVVALTASYREDWAEMNEALVLSRAAAPNQEGLAFVRARFGFWHRAQLTPDAEAVLMADIAIAATAQRGLDWIAWAYRTEPDARTLLHEAAGSEYATSDTPAP